MKVNLYHTIDGIEDYVQIEADDKKGINELAKQWLSDFGLDEKENEVWQLEVPE